MRILMSVIGRFTEEAFFNWPHRHNQGCICRSHPVPAEFYWIFLSDPLFQMSCISKDPSFCLNYGFELKNCSFQIRIFLEEFIIQSRIWAECESFSDPGTLKLTEETLKAALLAPGGARPPSAMVMSQGTYTFLACFAGFWLVWALIVMLCCFCSFLQRRLKRRREERLREQCLRSIEMEPLSCSPGFPPPAPLPPPASQLPRDPPQFYPSQTLSPPVPLQVPHPMPQATWVSMPGKQGFGYCYLLFIWCCDIWSSTVLLACF